MIDVALIETGSGADLIFRDGDLQPARGVENVPYLSQFGGTDDWWGNQFVEQPYDCKTEQALINNPLTSKGRNNIEEAIVEDIAYVKTILPDTTITQSVVITGNDALSVVMNFDGQQFKMLWKPDISFLNYSIK